jgi:hypothetical protein
VTQLLLALWKLQVPGWGDMGGGGGNRSEKGGQGKVCWRAGDWEGAVMGI